MPNSPPTGPLDDKQQTAGIDGGRLRRAAPIAGLAVRAGAGALRARVMGTADPQAVHARTAECYAQTPGRSKGALMKAGQMLSFVSFGPAIPADVRSAYQAALGRLRSDASPMARQTARTVLEYELGQPASQVFAEFDWEPLAAASIGQVHAARLHDGRAVAVKVQYPGVAAAIDADVKNTELVAALLGLFMGLSPQRLQADPRSVAREIASHIRDELSYRREALHQHQFAERYRGHPFIHVPDVVPEHCTDRILTQELAEGRTWQDALTAPQHLRDSWAEAIYRFAYGSINRGLMFNADPHPGNYLFGADGSVSFLDFGCVARLTHETTEINKTIVRACCAGDVLATWRASVEAGLWKASDPVTPHEVYDFWRAPFELYWGEQPFRLTPAYMDAWIERRYSPTGPSGNAFRHLATPESYAILGRTDIGVMSVIAALNAAAPWARIAAEWLTDNAASTPMGKLEEGFFTQRGRATPS